MEERRRRDDGDRDLADRLETSENFDWRISTATVARDGPFSMFLPASTEPLCILDGAGVVLHVADEPPRRLNDASPPVSFSGEEAAQARLIDGAVTDFNVMTRRTRFRHRVDRVRLRAGERRDVPPEVRAVFCQAGVVSIDGATGRGRLESRDTMLRHGPDGNAWSLLADEAATVCVVTISERPAAQTR